MDQAGELVAKGWSVESDVAQQEREAADRFAERNSGIGNMVMSGVEAGLRGLTAGGSDVLAGAIGGEDVQHAMSERKQAHPIISTVANVAGALVPAIATGGASAAESAPGIARSLLQASPAAKIAGIGSKIAGAAEGGGAVARTAATIVGGAAEGALYNAGGYIGDVALGDRKLSADGFTGAMGEGALWGGTAAGALKLTSAGMAAARKLIPAAEQTAAGASAARRAAASEISTAIEDSSALTAKADSKLADLSAQEELANPSYKQRIQEIRVQAAQDIADAQVAKARAGQTAAEARATSVKRGIEDKGTAAARRVQGKKLGDAMDFLKSIGTPIEEEAGAIGGAASAENELMSKLSGTKKAIDEGATLGEVSATKVQDAIHAELAKVNPEAAKIHEAATAAKDATAQMRKWLDTYGEGSSVAYDAANPAARRAKISDWAKDAPVGDEAGQVAQEHFQGNPERTKLRAGGMDDSQYPAEIRAAGNQAAAEAAHRAFNEATAEAVNVSTSGTELMARSRYAAERAAAIAKGEVYDAWHAGAQLVPTGEEILAAQAPPAAAIDKAIKARPADFADDINETASLITKHEASHADLAEHMGQETPIASQERAAGFRDAQQAAQEKAAAQVASGAHVLEKNVQATSLAKQLMDRAGDMGATYEALRMMGVPLPDPGKIPVIGKVLSAYLKAKLLGKAFGGHAGGILSTAETTIASKSAAIRQRVYSAADAMLEGGAKATGRLSEVGGGPAAILSHQLFATKAPAIASSAGAPPKGSIGALYLARAAEVNAAMAPGAIADAIKARVNTADPEALSEIIATHMRKLQTVADAMPRPSSPPSLIDGTPWLPSKQDLIKWTRTIAAVENPAAVFERAASGMASMDEIDAVRKVYPSLYADGQQRVLTQIADGKTGKLTTAAKAAVSRTWGIPVDHMSQPDFASFMQQGYQAAPVQVTPPGAPTISAPMNLGNRTMPRLDRGA